MIKTILAKKKLLIGIIESVILLLFVLFSIGTYSKTELLFSDDVMQLQDMQGNKVPGGGILTYPFQTRKLL
ncbi:MAG: hypothetical protein NC231_09540 [Bacillus sp. (in: Bacteria)]|nr:hypothetical protein [Bacillus sp. (in: firmicutes)]MCM1425397.1 hypothetical protein [Eubacterium sp.]